MCSLKFEFFNRGKETIAKSDGSIHAPRARSRLLIPERSSCLTRLRDRALQFGLGNLTRVADSTVQHCQGVYFKHTIIITDPNHVSNTSKDEGVCFARSQR